MFFHTIVTAPFLNHSYYFMIVGGNKIPITSIRITDLSVRETLYSVSSIHDTDGDASDSSSDDEGETPTTIAAAAEHDASVKEAAPSRTARALESENAGN